MPGTRVVFVHTVAPLVEVFGKLAARMLPDVSVMHILDEPLLERVRQRRGLHIEDGDRLTSHVQEAVAIGAAAVLVTCSTVSPAVEWVRQRVAIPVLKIDEAMVAAAVETGTRIGIVATNQTTLAPTEQLLADTAARIGHSIETELVLVERALPALLAGNTVLHDELIKAAVVAAAGSVDVIVLAQASMARVLDMGVAANIKTPILASPPLAMQQLAGVLAQKSQANKNAPVAPHERERGNS